MVSWMRENFDTAQRDAAEERVVVTLRELVAEGYPPDLIADVTMAIGVHLVERIYGRNLLLEHIGRLLRSEL
jgi:hypothetical protein